MSVGADPILTTWSIFDRRQHIDITLNKNSTVTFSPSAKVAYNLIQSIDLGVEYYADNLPMKAMYGVTRQPNTAYLVMDAKLDKTSFNIGIGKGLNSTSDNWVVKFIGAFSFD